MEVVNLNGERPPKERGDNSWGRVVARRRSGMEQSSNKALQDFAGRTRYVCNAICSERPPGPWRRHWKPQAAGLKMHEICEECDCPLRSSQSAAMTAERGRCRRWVRRLWRFITHCVQALTPNITFKPQRVSLIYDVSNLTGYWSKTLGRQERPSTTAEGD
jgi:hypothetical protein